MKSKLTLLLALTLVFTLTVPVMASPFQDVPANHWANDALEQVVEAGLISGYNDGSFKGDQDLNRYEVAVLTAKVLNKINEEDKEVSEETAQAINKLATEFDKELAQVDSRLKDLETVQINGETGVEYNDVEVEGPGTSYEDPYNKDFDGDDENYADDGDTDDIVETEDIFEQYADFNVNVAQDGLEADLDLEVVNNYFGNTADESNFKLDSISGKITTEDFVANIGDDQDLGWKDYLFANDDNINGVVLEAGDSTVALGKDGEQKTIAAKQDNLFELPVNLYAGKTEDNTVVAADTAFKLAGLDLTGEVATSDKNLEETLARVGVSKDLGKLNLAAEYQHTDNFTGIQTDYDAGEETTLTANVAEENPYNVYGVEVFGNYEYEVNSKDEARYVEANKDLGNVDLAAIYDYDNTDDKSDKVVSAAYAPEFKVAGVKLAPQAKVAAIYDKNNNQAINKEASLDATYEVNDKLTAKAGYAWANKEDRVDIEGEKVVANAGLDYQVTEDATATVNYENAEFTGANSADSFNTQTVNGQVSVNF
ncbi:hypothetical protein JCM16358_13110 [Halanaerocella petrolearia]